MKFGKKLIGTVLALLACFFLGCATKKTTTSISSNPIGVGISVNEEYQGETPLTIDLVKDSKASSEFYSTTFIFRAEKEGYKTETRVFKGRPFQALTYVVPSRLHFALTPKKTGEDVKLSVKKDDAQKEDNLAKHYSGPIDKFKYNKTLGKKWALVIGISNYYDTRIPSLRYAATDAKSFYKWLIAPNGGKLAISRVNLLLEENATGKNIKTSLFVWLNQALEEDMVIIYFSGHGSPESPDSQDNLFLLPYDIQYDNIAPTGFPMWDIETALKRFIKAKKVVVIADACHSGGVGQAFDISRRSMRAIKVNTISSGLQNLSKVGDGVCVISASDNKQFSQENQKWGGGHGVFTYFLLKGLKGEADYNRDGSVSLGELIPFLSEEVRRETRNAQSPTVSGKFDPALTISR